jgi:hypothetical protein
MWMISVIKRKGKNKISEISEISSYLVEKEYEDICCRIRKQEYKSM